MAFADVAALAIDPDYQARLSACVYTEALAKPGDKFSNQIIKLGPNFATACFGPTVAAAPGLGDLYAGGGQAAVTDGDLLAAVQANWARVAALFTAP